MRLCPRDFSRDEFPTVFQASFSFPHLEALHLFIEARLFVLSYRLDLQIDVRLNSLTVYSHSIPGQRERASTSYPIQNSLAQTKQIVRDVYEKLVEEVGPSWCRASKLAGEKYFGARRVRGFRSGLDL